MMESFVFDAGAIGAYHTTDAHRGAVCVEINDGEPLAFVYLDPEEARELARELLEEAEVAERIVAA